MRNFAMTAMTMTRRHDTIKLENCKPNLPQFRCSEYFMTVMKMVVMSHDTMNGQIDP